MWSKTSERTPPPWGALAAITAVALGARLIGVNGGLWIDEIYSLLDSFRPPLSTILTHFPGDTQHPLYSVLANLSRSLFGEASWSIRLPAVLFGTASVPVLYALGARVTDRREGLLAAAFLAVSYHHVWFSQNARGYTALAFFALLSTLLLLAALESGRWTTWLLYGLAIGLGVYAHLTMAFLVAAQALVAFPVALFGRREGKDSTAGAVPIRVLAGFLTGVFVGALLYLPVFTQVLDFFLHRPSQLVGVSTPSWALSEALRVLGIGLGTGVGLVLAAGLGVAGALGYLRKSPMVLALFVLPGVTTLGGALLARGTMYPRFFFFMVGFGILVLVRGAFVVGDWLERRRGSVASGRSGTVIAGAMIAVSALSVTGNYRAPKQDFGGAMSYLDEVGAPGDQVATVGVTARPYRDLYERSWVEVQNADELAALQRRTAGTLRVVYTFQRYLEVGYPDVASRVLSECAIERVFPGTVGGGDIVVCALPPRPPLSAPGGRT